MASPITHVGHSRPDIGTTRVFPLMRHLRDHVILLENPRSPSVPEPAAIGGGVYAPLHPVTPPTSPPGQKGHVVKAPFRLQQLLRARRHSGFRDQRGRPSGTPERDREFTTAQFTCYSWVNHVTLHIDRRAVAKYNVGTGISEVVGWRRKIEGVQFTMTGAYNASDRCRARTQNS